MTASAAAVAGADPPVGELELFARGFDAFLDAVLEPDVQQILITPSSGYEGQSRNGIRT
jgi:hypothetical protein